MTAKAALKPIFEALYNFAPGPVAAAFNAVFLPDAKIQLCDPFPVLKGPEALVKEGLGPLAHAIPDLERRNTILISGKDQDGQNWVGSCGYYTGTFVRPFLDIPATGHFASFRFHEFFQVEDGKVKEMQALWDLPELMMQANAWPMAPSLGREWQVPGPATQDGILSDARDEARSRESLNLVGDMLIHLGKHATEGVEGMRLGNFWHPRCSWYGPSGIGSCRGISGFRNWHQIPFLNAMPDRTGTETGRHFFADGNYVGFTAWPGMRMTISGDGFLGIAPANQKITMRSLDFWRCEGSLIRENWVLVDVLDVFRQIGVDVLGRMREFNKARFGFDPATGATLT